MKITKTYRLEPETIRKLEELTKIYQTAIDKASSIKAKVTMTEVIETLIAKEYAAQKERADHE